MGAWLNWNPIARKKIRRIDMHSIFYFIGLVVVVVFVLRFLGLW
jgi:hypothetical protein